PYKTISTLNTISELDDESLIYDGQNISTSTLLQVPFYEIISMLNTIAELDDESLTYDGQNSSTSTSLQ
ncbi:11335_t:CDS:2, partial [Gigaspora margarita]